MSQSAAEFLEAGLRLRRRAESDGFALDAEFRMPMSGITVLRGPSAAGKTTLLRCLAGLERPEPGSWLRFGENYWQDSRRSLAPHRRPIALVFQDARLLSHIDVSKNLNFARRHVCRPDEDGGGLSEEPLYEALGLTGLLDRQPRQLSGGERRRVAIAAALLRRPRLLLLDEPLVGLDRNARRQVTGYLRQYVAELRIPVLWVSHDLEEAGAVADHLLLLEAGTVVGSGPLLSLCADLDTPLVDSGEAGAIVEGRVRCHDRKFQLSAVDIGGQELWLHRLEQLPGESVRLRIRGRDVSLSLAAAVDSSVLNCIPARVDRLREISAAEVLVRLAVGRQYLLACVTRKSCAELQLAVGMSLYAQVKAGALLQPW